jgi:Glycine/serine hydroxymethyltransferase
LCTSGLTIGTPASTTRLTEEAEVSEVTSWICDILDDINNEQVINEVKNKVKDICSRFPVYS